MNLETRKFIYGLCLTLLGLYGLTVVPLISSVIAQCIQIFSSVALTAYGVTKLENTTN